MGSAMAVVPGPTRTIDATKMAPANRASRPMLIGDRIAEGARLTTSKLMKNGGPAPEEGARRPPSSPSTRLTQFGVWPMACLTARPRLGQDLTRGHWSLSVSCLKVGVPLAETT